MTGPVPPRDVIAMQCRPPHGDDDRVAPPPPPHDHRGRRLPTEDFHKKKKKRKLVSSCENIPSLAVSTTTTTTTTTAVSRRSSIVDYLFQRATTTTTAHVPLIATTIPPIIPWCIPSNLHFHPLLRPSATTTQILNIRFGASTNHDTTTSTTTGGQIAICYRSFSSSSSGHCQVAIYQWNTILQATIVGRQKMIRDIILMTTTTPETTWIKPDDPTSLHRLITTIPPDLCFPIVLPSSNNNNHNHTANTHHDRLVVFEYASTNDAVSQQQQQLHLIVGFHRHTSLLVYPISAMLLHHHHPRQQPPPSHEPSDGSDPHLCCTTQLRTHGTGVPATIDAPSKLIVVTTTHGHNNTTTTTTIVLLTRRWIMGWKYHPKRPSSPGQRQCDTNNNNNNTMMIIPYHWQFQYGTDAFTTITQLPNHHHHNNVCINDTVSHDDRTATAARAVTLLVVGTSGGTFMVLNMDQLQYPSMSCTLSPTIVHVWTSFRNTTSGQSNRIGEWLNYEQRHYQQRSNHNVHNNGGSQGLGIRALAILPEMYLPSARQPANDYKVRYRFIWITMNGWILSTHIEVSISTALSNVGTVGGSTTATIHVRRKSKAPYYDGICHVHYSIKPIVYRNSTDHSVLIHPPQPTWNYFEHHDEATSSFPVSISSHGILWYNPLDQDKYTSPQPLPQLPNPDVRVLSSNRSIHISAVSTNTTGHDSMAPQKSSSRRQHSMVPKLNYIGYDQIRRQSLKSHSTCNDDSSDEIAISRIRARKPTTPHNQHPTCLWMHPDRPLEHILVGTPDCGLYLMESKNKIQIPRPK